MLSDGGRSAATNLSCINYAHQAKVDLRDHGLIITIIITTRPKPATPQPAWTSRPLRSWELARGDSLSSVSLSPRESRNAVSKEGGTPESEEIEIEGIEIEEVD